jgi:hypothetical protein
MLHYKLLLLYFHQMKEIAHRNAGNPYMTFQLEVEKATPTNT